MNHWQNLTAVGERMDVIGYENEKLKLRVSKLETENAALKAKAAEVVAELRRNASYQNRDVRAYGNSQADLVAEKFGVTP